MVKVKVTLNRPKLTSYQKDILYCEERFTVTQASTKVGKTFSHLWWLYEKALKPPKVGANYWWVAPVYTQAEIAFNRLRRVDPDARVNLTKLIIELPEGSIIHFKSADNPDNLYGEDVYAAVFDEFTRAKESAWTALRSTLTATRGQCKFIGNAKGRKNWGYKLALRAKNNEPGYRFFKITAYDAVAAGVLDAAEVEQAKRDLPEDAFNELYLAEILDDQANPFGIKHIASRVKPISKKPAVVYGIDLAKSVDWTVVVGLDNDGDVCFFDRWQSDWAQTKRRIQQIVGHCSAAIDSTGVGDAIVEDLQRSLPKIEGYKFSSTSKQQLMEGLSAAIQKGEVSILEGVMQDELEAFEFEYTRTGVKYSAPAGVHDDTVCALALAVYKFKHKPAAPILTFHR